MAALVLSFAGATAGSALFGPAGALAGRLAGALAGNLLDRTLLGGGNKTLEGPRLADLDVMASTEGAPIARVYGRARIAGQVIWATRLEEVVAKSVQSAGGKGAGPKSATNTYSYFANFAVGLCEGPVGHVSRIWADGKLLDLTGVTWRSYPGSNDQLPDPLIVAKEGAANAPAYRGLSYVVFERLPLADFGNRIPQLSFEVMRPIGRLETMVRAVTLIPGTTEFGYEPGPVTRTFGPGQSAPENRHVFHATSDIEASLDELQALCPNLERVALVVAWFGTDLRAAQCAVRPAVESAGKATFGAEWAVSGLTRRTAPVVSQVEGRPAYGGTPSDASVVHLIHELNARGIKVTLYPFVMMDIPAGNALPDPWTGSPAQSPYPWRGRITCDPAPGRPGSPDGTAAAGAQVAAVFGSAQRSAFSVWGQEVVYAGPAEWTLRRMVLHYANLAMAAGGVDAFLLGSELRGLTRVRAGAGYYPAVAQLVALATDVKAVLGAGTKVTYGADWTEYGAHVVDAAAAEVRFPLDPLWASPAIDAVGIDYYAPLADWRDEAGHRDLSLADTTYDRTYLAGNLRAGEGYAWFYPDAAARAAQNRAPITDGAAGKPWTFRVKDLWNWWGNAHHERVGGTEVAQPTAWQPRAKPIWITEVGCPAVDKGANQPSVFPDPKSGEAALPFFSNGSRDDLMQRRYIEAVLGAFDPAHGATAESNPTGSYGGRMVERSHVYLWTWDARPYPVFPAAREVWSDGANWETGHWLTGRFGAAPLDALVPAILADTRIVEIDADDLREAPDGYVVDRPMSPRAALQPLTLAYAFDAVEEGERLRFRARGRAPAIALSEDDLVLPDDEAAPFRLVRAQETELPREVSLGFTDAGGDYRRSVVTARRAVGGSARKAHADLAVVTSDAAAERRADVWLQDLWAGRESADFALPPSRIALTAGDVVDVELAGRSRRLEIREIVDAESRAVKTRAIDPGVFSVALGAPRRRAPTAPASLAPVHVSMLDLPTMGGEDPPVLLRAATFADPWPGAVAVWRSDTGASFERVATAPAPSVVGETLGLLRRGPTSRWDRNVRLRIRLFGGALASLPESAVLGGANVAALRRADGAWEVFQFASAALVEENIYELSTLLRGQAGSEWAMGDPLFAGAPFVLLDEHLTTLASGLDALGRPLRWRFGSAGRDHGDPAVVELQATPGATALRPLAPVHLRGQRTGDGVRLSWIRRTRRDGDSWEAGEVPLGEERELYDVEILAVGAPVRRWQTAEPATLYSKADELADFGAPQPSLTMRVFQLSASVGRGVPAQSTLTNLV